MKLILYLIVPQISVTCEADGATKYAIIDTKLYILVVTLSYQNIAKLLDQRKSGFKRIINWTKYQSSPKKLSQNWYWTHLINRSFQGVNRLILLLFKEEHCRTVYTGYYLRKVEIKDFNVMIDGRHFFDQLVGNNIIPHENNWKKVNCKIFK